MQKRPLPDSRPLAIALTCAASFLFAFLDTGAKYLATVAHMPVLQIIWVRFMVNTLLIVVMLGPKQVRRALPSNKLMNQLLRSVFLIGATAFNFLALQHLQLDQTATIFFLSPFIVAALAGPMLGEWIGWHRILVAAAVVMTSLLLAVPSISYAGCPIGAARGGWWFQTIALTHYSGLVRIFLSTGICVSIYLIMVACFGIPSRLRSQSQSCGILWEGDSGGQSYARG
jgi:drug/metabolite transporter (DMT)-like permease